MKKLCYNCKKKIGAFKRHFRIDEIKGNDSLVIIRRTKKYYCADCGDYLVNNL